jgi:hypothetical protein
VAEKFIDDMPKLSTLGKVDLSWVANPSPNDVALPSAGGETVVTEEPTASVEEIKDNIQEESTNSIESDHNPNGLAESGHTDVHDNGGDPADYDVADDEDRWMAA